MASSFLLALREGLEATLIIGIVLGAVLKMGRPDLKRPVWLGVAVSIVLCLGISIWINQLKMEFDGYNAQVFEGVTMLLAAGVLTWMIFWMLRTAPNLRKELEEKTNNAVTQNAFSGIFFVAFLAVFREGIELTLFLLAVNSTSDPLSVGIGASLGLITSIVLGWAIFNSTIKLEVRQFFKVTNILLIIMAAGMVAYGVHELNEAGIIPAIIDPLWDINWLLNDKGTIGSILKALFGYNGNPSLSEVMLYLVYLSSIGFISLRYSQKNSLKI